MIIGLFGGTFDPPHKGHSGILKAAARTSFFDKIIIIPAAVPARKSIYKVSMPSYRYEMLKIWLSSNRSDLPDHTELSDLELKRTETSYTIDTIRELKGMFGIKTRIYLICGSDLISEIESWHRPEEILREAGIFAAIRPGIDPAATYAKSKELKERFSADIVFFESPHTDVSSAQIRQMISDNNSYTEGMLPDTLGEWIIKNRIYDKSLGFDDDFSEEEVLTLLKYESMLRDELKSDRLIHSLNTMRFCVALARVNKQKPFKFAVAGLLHDCAKQSVENNEPFCSHIPPEIRHSYSGSRVAKKKFGVGDVEILDAIKYHTTSRPGATLMGKIVFAADKIEPARVFPRIDELREITFRNIDEGYRECLSDIIKYLEIKGCKAHPDTYAAYYELQYGIIKERKVDTGK